MTEVINGVPKTYSYTYNEDNRLTSMTVDGVTVEYTYDTFGRLSQQVTKQGDTTILTEQTGYNDTDATASNQVTSYNGFTYTYDKNGNILSVSDGTNTTTYVYDSQNQLIRENNQAWNYTHTWTYDNAGNILSRTEYDYTTAEDLSALTPTDTVSYSYSDGEWGDLLASYDSRNITYDEIGNPLNDGEWTYSWKNGRQLESMSKGNTTWTYTYDANGMRIKSTDGISDYTYIYNGDKLVRLLVDSYEYFDLTFTYDANGTPLTITERGITYYYVTNLQGDVIGIKNSSGQQIVTYSYDAWGNLLYRTNTQLADYNPLRYRGYVYDFETGLYYLQSRYYDPEIGRFINADNYPTTGQGLNGNNMFAYCGNNPVSRSDDGGEFWNIVIGAAIGGTINLVTSTISAIVEYNTNPKFRESKNVGWKIAGMIITSTAIGSAEGALVAACPAAAAGISAAASVCDTVVTGLFVGDSAGKIVADSIISGGIGAVAGSGGSDFVKGGKLINDAVSSIGNAYGKGVRSIVKKEARKMIKKAGKYIGRKYLSGQLESFAYWGMGKYGSTYVEHTVLQGGE